MASATALQESSFKRNPHPDFKKVEAARPDWDDSLRLRFTKTVAPSWSFGDGANSSHDDPGLSKHVVIDPYESGRPGAFNYKLLISAVTPRPIAFVSTRSADGKTTNIAPFSYFSMINHDPPLFTIGFTSASSRDRAKDTLRNIVDTSQCVINIVSEGFVEAANSCAVDAPYGTNEWAVSGLTPAYDCVDVPGVARVREAVFSIEAKLESVREFESRTTPGKITGSLVVLEGTRFWVREDALNEEKNMVDPAILRPISRLGGITYGRLTEAMEITRPDFRNDIGGVEGYEKLKQPSVFSSQVLPE